ncbi:MAG: prolipoprotein diacylglyceryl transferase [Rhodobacteraceae bacterium]|nr:prolipoprotein diacylglyceryl transferase [Paracoccaceae bacterium]
MIAALPFPEISPDLFSFEIGGFAFALRWYALAYIAGILIAWRMVVRLVRAPRLWPGEAPPMTATHAEDLLTWMILGIIFGGRLGFVIFYQPGYYFSNPSEIPMIWQGGMSFHGGLLGVVLAGVLYCRKHGLPMIKVADAVAVSVPPGLFLGRVANFINAELWGRPTDLPWGVIFPGERAQFCPGVVEELCARHPSQLYEAGLEGLVLGAVLLWVAWRRDWLKVPGQTMGLFFAGYGLSRFVVEYYRQPDAQFITADNPLGHVIALGPVGLTMGQLLSLPMLIFGLAVIRWARRRA